MSYLFSKMAAGRYCDVCDGFLLRHNYVVIEFVQFNIWC